MPSISDKYRRIFKQQKEDVDKTNKFYDEISLEDAIRLTYKVEYDKQRGNNNDE